MKTRTLVCLAIIAGIAATNPTASAKEKKADTKMTAGKKVTMTGTVKKNAIGICPMEGAKWDLLSNVGQPTHLASGNDEVTKVLNQVAGTRKRVTVEGTQMAGVECPHVKVDKATPAK